MSYLCCNPVLLYFIAQIIPPLDTGSSLSCLLCTFDILPCSPSPFLSIILLPGTARCSKLILQIFCPSARICQFCKGPGVFDWRMVLEIKTQHQVCSLLLGCHYFQTLSADKTRKYMDTLTSLYVYIYKCFYM